MALENGTRLGPYEILAPIGAGGMGEVYRAKDTRLDRTVAVKVLPVHAIDRPEARERFEREARAISSINHPNICTLYDVGTHAGSPYIVMEHLEGETLATRLDRGALPPDQALKIAVEIGSALDRAHRSGVVHRDLKPGNIVLTKSGAKLLDFGLAKLAAPETGLAAGLSRLATGHKELTAEGTILGTFQYMAPEQLEGQEADSRTDIFAFGAVMYEMATGRKAFSGKSQASLIASILAADPPPISTIQAMAPPALDRVVRRCLAKEPEDRWQSAADLASELRWIAEGGSQAGIPAPVVARRRNRERLFMAATILFGVAAVALAGVALRPGRAPAETPVMRFSIPPPEKLVWRSFNSFALSPDGKHLVFFGRDAEGVARFYLRATDTQALQPLTGTETGDASFPFWSPDSRFIGFFAGGKLKKIDITGGPPQVLCDAVAAAGGAWSNEGVILFSPSVGSPIYRVPASGGEPTPVTHLAAEKGKESHAWPVFLPGGHRFLYLSAGEKKEDHWIMEGDLAGGPGKRLIPGVDSEALFAPPGDLLFLRDGALFAQAFDAAAGAVAGEPVLIAEGVGQNQGVIYGAFSASETGILAYRAGGPVGKQQTWFDRNGRPLGAVGPKGAMIDAEISPDEKKVALVFGNPGTRAADIWTLDPARGTSSRFSFEPTDHGNPIWSGDGQWIYFVSSAKGHADIYRKLASGTGEEEPVFVSDDDKQLEDVALNGSALAYSVVHTGGSSDIYILPLAGKKEPRILFKTTYRIWRARFSPDGKYLAYTSDETGKEEVYVVTYPVTSGKWQISTNGGGQPRWRRDGRELYFLAPNSKLMAVSIKAQGNTFEAGLPSDLFETGMLAAGVRNHYTVSADGQRFLVGMLSGGTESPPLTFVLNWTALLKK
jgi:Tol biopolymer transport system component/tRNA A-37 threonylcarbamoyl transferase component Bud32